ncbi:MAG TPA: zinc/iron-chelating domain-containing protein [Spirochaeta sp.]|nr:zinc/iron-chelating domain-containing protein [Spirochaeta sp.]
MNLESELQKAQNLYKENKKLIEKLKRWKRKDLDALFVEVHEAVFADLDCRECGNCCKSLGPKVNNRDIERIGKYINMRAGKVRNNYLDVDEDNDFVFQSMPCPFLKEDNFCSIYEARPRACKEYPHTDYPNMQKKLNLTLKNSLICPAVYRMLNKIRPKVMD